MKLKDVVNPEFIKAINKIGTTNVPILTAYRVMTVSSKLEQERQKFDELRRALVNKYAPKDETGEIKKDDKGQYSVDPEQIESFLKEINELLEVDVETAKIKLSALGDKLEITALELQALGDLIEE